MLSDITGNDSPITSATILMLTFSRDFSRLMSSNIPLSDILPTGVSPENTGSCEKPSSLMRLEAACMVSVLCTETIFLEQTSAAVRPLPISCCIASSVSNSVTTVS